MRTEVIATARLSLCTASPADFRPLYEAVLSVPEVMCQVMGGHALSEEEARAFYEEKFDHEGTGTRFGVLVERHTARVIGFSGLMPCSVLGAPDHELGFVLAPQYWGKGYAQEIGKGQLAFGFAKLKCSRLLAQVSPQNPSSIRALERLGMLLHSTANSEGRGARHIYVAAAP